MSNQNRNYPILLVDDDKSVLDEEKSFLEEHCYPVDVSTCGEDAIRKVKADPDRYALILLDYIMEPRNGADICRELLKINPFLCVIMLSGSNTFETAQKVLEAGARGFLVKGTDARTKLITIKMYCQLFDRELRKVQFTPSSSEAESLISEMGMVGRSPAMAKAAHHIKQYSNLNQTVLIRGETGTGKEVVAKSIHSTSNRSDKPFIAVNCAAIPEQLIESELFGHEKGAFTGADRAKTGKFVAAHGGTLFLDEIGDLSFPLQAKLLRVLQERKVQPVGSLREIPIDVRIVAATHQNLEAMLEKKKFREDLYYRINVLNIELPPLRDRSEDIEPLVAYFTEEYCQRNKVQKRFLARAVRKLEQMPWRGNVRELKNCVEKLLTQISGNVVDMDQIELEAGASITTGEMASLAELQNRHELEKRNFVIGALKKTQWNINRAAEKIGSKRQTLQSIMKKLGIMKESA